MDLIKKVRELGADIQKDERYISFMKAKEANEKDDELNELIGKINLIQMSYQQEAQKEDADEQKLSAYDDEFRGVYEKIMQNENMKAYEAARREIDELMNYIMQILGLCVNGADPDTCEPEKHECSGECSHCSGC